MMRSLFSGISGLKNHQTRMDVIGNNISNVNTTGFKSGRVTFADMLSQTLTGASAPQDGRGGTNPKQIGLGSSVSSIDTIFTDGSVQSTGKNTDLCLSGNGLFVVKDSSGIYYTRNGAFEFDADGNYVLPGSGLYVQGWMANNGALPQNKTDGNMQAICIPAGSSMGPQASQIASYTNNIKSNVPTITDVSLEPTDKEPHRIALSDGTIVPYDRTRRPPYKVGDKYEIPPHTDPDDRVVLTPSNSPLTLELKSGRKVTLDYEVDGDFVARVDDSYNYTSKTEGDMSYAVSTPDNIVTLQFANGDTPSGENGERYIIGNIYTSRTSDDPDIKNSGMAGKNNVVKLVLENDDPITDNSSGIDYSVGYNYPIKNSSDSGVSSSGAPAPNNIVKFKTTDGREFTDPADYPNGSPNTDYSLSGTIFLPDGTQATVASFTVYSPVKSFTVKSRLESFTETSPITSITETSKNTVKALTYLASEDEPITIKLSDGISYIKHSGEYAVGWSNPLVTTLTVYDTLGTVHDVTLYFTQTVTDSTNGNKWLVSVDPNPVNVNSDGYGETTIAEGGQSTTVRMQDTVLHFDTNGRFVQTYPTTSSFTEYPSGKINLELTNGSTGTQTIPIDLTALTQYASGNTIAGKADGHAPGTLASVSIDSSGIITGTYTNGVKQAEAQIAVAQFNNAAGLTKTGNSLYQESNNSGVPNIKTAGDLGVTITPSALEMSNVDMANEFTDMIITQRGFQGNSKIITVSDEMLETLINMKR